MIVGALIATKTGNPLLGLIFAWGSHYILDIIPHRDYDIGGIEGLKEKNIKKFLQLIMKVGTDFCLGLLFVILLFKNTNNFPALALSGAIFGIGPDIITFLFYRFNITQKFFVSHQRFHQWCNHWYEKFGIEKTPIWLGVLTQLMILSTLSSLAFY